MNFVIRSDCFSCRGVSFRGQDFALRYRFSAPAIIITSHTTKDSKIKMFYASFHRSVYLYVNFLEGDRSDRTRSHVHASIVQ
jgi:hypothetical protein